MELLHQARVLVRGAGELGSGVAAHLARQGFGRVLMVERAFPKAVRRNVCFSEAVFNHGKTVDGVTARFVMLLSEVDLVHELGDLAITTQPLPEVLAAWPPDIFVDAAMQRANWGLSRELAPLVIALGPGLPGGQGLPRRGRDGARAAARPGAPAGGQSLVPEPPAEIMGFTQERVIKAQRPGIFRTNHDIGNRIERGEKIGVVVLLLTREDLYRGVPVDSEYPVVARISGVVRGLLRDGVPVETGDKIGDVDPRGITDDLEHISDKAQRVAEGVLEAIVLNKDRVQPREAARV